jgi:sialate O-acetylesterase
MRLLNGLLLFFSIGATAQVKLPALVCDSMVLQRNTPLTIWGWASSGEKINVQFHGFRRRAVTSPIGRWLVSFPAMPAGGPYTMVVRGRNIITLTDILIGDVWFCSGQSNMVLPMERVKEKYSQDIAGAAYPEIRNFTVPTSASIVGVAADLLPGHWKAANPRNVLGFGAASYFFARSIYQRYHIPIGIINASVGGSPIEAWISEEGLHELPDYIAQVHKFRDLLMMQNPTRQLGTYVSMPTEGPDKGLTGPLPWYATDYIPAGWHPFWLPGYWADQGVKDLHGTVWFRKEIEVSAAVAAAGKARLFLGRIVDADQTYVNGLLVGGITYQYPPRRYVLDSGMLKPGKNVIVVRVVNTSGKGGFVPDKPYYLQAGDIRIDLRGDWCYQVGQVLSQDSTVQVFLEQNTATCLYNGMVAPASHYAIKGFVWYQGETNTGRPKEYAQLLPMLITDWRHQWGDLPFLYVQLPNYGDVNYSPSESNWAEMREGQLKTLAVPHTAMAVTIDVGEWNDLHPLDKKDVWERLALAAEHLAYSDSSVVYSGPVYQSYQVLDNKMILSFTQTGSGLIAKGGGDLQYFAIAGLDKKFVWAKATINGATVTVWNDSVPHPMYVRYAWADNPEGANLYNQEGLPASPFETR